MPVELLTFDVTIKAKNGSLRETFGIVAVSRLSAVSHAHVLFAQRYGEKAIGSECVSVKERSRGC